jgi:large subunit ribosomal protein L15
MDKDSIILRYEQEILDEAEEDVSQIKQKNDYQEKKLEEMQEQLMFLKKDSPISSHKSKIKLSKPNIDLRVFKPKTIDNYDELLRVASESLTERGISPYDISIYDMISEEELGEILKEINAPLPREDKWTKADFIIVFIAAVVGSITDFVLGNRDNKYTGKNSKFSEWLNENLHEGNHSTNASIDFQGKNFGGGYHRELSRGHDILRFIDGIKMFKEGKFKGKYFADGVAYFVEEVVNPKNNVPYAQLSTIEALVEAGLVKKALDGVKVLGNGELSKKLTVQVNAYSESAKQKIEAAGGKAEVI